MDSQPFSEDTACFIVAGVFCFSVADCCVAMGGLCQAIVVSRVARSASLLATSLEFQDVSQCSMAFRFSVPAVGDWWLLKDSSRNEHPF